MNFVLKEQPLKLRVITLSSLPYKPDKEWRRGCMVMKLAKKGWLQMEMKLTRKRHQGIGAAQLELWRATIEVVKGNDE